ncbi:hypothetical protein HMPREF1214_01637 [Bacteroides sp. HPS0048]|nr:hypothetical protein HMPREF1214_01637 [Bacteroides sp. HPS0048]
MNMILKIIGFVLSKLYGLMCQYNTLIINGMIGGGKRMIAYPYTIRGANNILASEPINIGPNSTIYTTRAKLIIKSHFIVWCKCDNTQRCNYWQRVNCSSRFSGDKKLSAI